jgi:hypothetical protein
VIQVLLVTANIMLQLPSDASYLRLLTGAGKGLAYLQGAHLQGPIYRGK